MSHLSGIDGNTQSLCIEDGTIVNVFSKELIPGQSVIVKGDTIRYVGDEPGPYMDEQCRRISAGGALVLPGFIDAHNHLDSLVRVDEYARYLLPLGCTAVVTEMAMAANAVGAEKLIWFMRSGRSLPLRIYYLVPPNVPPFPRFESAHEFPDDAYERILQEPDVVGVGEAYWPMIIKPEDRVLRLWSEARRMGKTCEGHTAGANEDKLITYLYRGATSCHESITWEEALTKIRQGYTVMIREGFVRKDLEAVAPVYRKIKEFRNLILVSDVFPPQELVEGRGLHSMVEKAVKLGFDPITAIQMVSLNPAVYFNLRDLGAVAAGRKADLFLADGFHDLKPHLVVAGGRVCARDGKLTIQVPEFTFPPEAYHTINMEPINEDHLKVPARATVERVRVVSIQNETIAQEKNITLTAEGKGLVSDPGSDVVKMAVFNRHRSEPSGAVGFLHGTGLREGAVATNMIWDTTNVLVIGATDQEMVAAVNRLLHNGGGWVVSRGHEILCEIALPIFGLWGDMSLSEVVEKSKKMDSTLSGLGLSLSRPFLTLQTLPFTGLPFLRLTDRGLVDVRRGKMVPLRL